MALTLVPIARRVEADTQFVPVLSVQERYDSNVLFVNPKLVPGVDVEDFVTSISPQIMMKSRGGMIDVNGSVGAIGEIYKNNPSLNYVGFNAGLMMGLTPLVSRLSPRTTVDVYGSYQYTPQPPAFLAGSQANVQDPYVRGIQSFRTNTTSYMAGQRGSYRFTPTLSFVESYTFSQIKYGTTQVPDGAATGLLDTSSHMLSAGPAWRATANDEFSNQYGYNAFEQHGVGSFSTYGATLGWNRTWSPTLRTQVTGGLQLTSSSYQDASGSAVREVTLPMQAIPQARLLVNYSSASKALSEFVDEAGQLTGLPQLAGTIMPGGTESQGGYSFTLNYSYGAFPLFLAGGGLMKSHVLGVIGAAGLTSRLTANFGANFARNESTSTVQNFSFESIGANAGLSYLITPSLRASLTYSYINNYGIGNEASSLQSQSAVEFLTYNRQIVMLSVAYAFGGGSQFFQGGGFFSGVSTGTSGMGR